MKKNWVEYNSSIILIRVVSQMAKKNFDISASNDYAWRDYCEDGDNFDVDPEDYETEEDIEEK